MYLMQQQQQEQSPWDDVTPEGELGLGLVPERAIAGEAACVAAGEAVWQFFCAYVVADIARDGYESTRPACA
jgi:hypothetical protein